MATINRATAVVLRGARQLELLGVDLAPLGATDVLVDVDWSAISSGTERLLWSGSMPVFPGMGYPLVPGYETVGRVIEAGADAPLAVGDSVFVPGASCFGEIRGLFGGAASQLVVAAARVTRIDAALGENGVLLALAATARHAIAGGDGRPIDLIIGHGTLGRLLARITLAAGHEPVVWETNPARFEGAEGYRVVQPDDDTRRDYKCICDASGDASAMDSLIRRLARGGEIILAGFYDKVEFAFPAAFMKEARFRIASEFQPTDLAVILALVSSGKLDLGGLITHREPFDRADDAYRTAFTDPACLKMLIDWRACP